MGKAFGELKTQISLMLPWPVRTSRRLQPIRSSSQHQALSSGRNSKDESEHIMADIDRGGNGEHINSTIVKVEHPIKATNIQDYTKIDE